MNSNRLVVAAAVGLAALACGVGGAGAQTLGPQATISPYAGVGVWSDDLHLASRAIVGGRLGARVLPWLGLEGTYGYSSTESGDWPNGVSFDTKVTHYGIGLVVDVLREGPVIPYATGGWAQLKHDSDDANRFVGGTSYAFTGFEVGGGVRLRMVEDDGFTASIRADARDVITDLVQWFDNYEDSHHNLLLTVGLEVALGPSLRDTDGDGVKDRDDLCPGTPLGALVNEYGCGLDSDLDGVPDGVDKCDGTPRGARVTREGCSFDSDGDGVPDGLDQCEATPAGAGVDWHGCPADGDGDGVFDGIDRCPDTIAGALVDGTGCPQDSDGDGVPDGIDLCEDTPAGSRVDSKGCPIALSTREAELLDRGVIRLSNIQFASGRAEVPSSAFAALDEIGQALIDWPVLRIEIGGHTDSSGDAAYNEELSRRRAQAVLDYIGARFPLLDLGRFVVRGYGESKPIDDNDTEEGRQKNRRVEFTVLNREALGRH